MASLSPGQRERNWEARERLLAAFHEAGIDPGSPLGLVLMGQAEGAMAVSEHLREAMGRTEEMMAQSVSELAYAKAALAEGKTQLDALVQAGRERLDQQSRLREAEVKQTLARIVAGVTGELRSAVFGELRRQLPAHEGAYYRTVRWSSYAKMTMAGVVLVLVGFASGRAFDWHVSRVGAYCVEHTQIEPQSRRPWCLLSGPTALQ